MPLICRRVEKVRPKMLRSVPLGMHNIELEQVFTTTAWFGAVGAPQNTGMRGVCAAH
jgi:hypothetical protein